ncbi:MAG: SRPBCC family protein [Vicinamibacterales bacterium]
MENLSMMSDHSEQHGWTNVGSAERWGSLAAGGILLAYALSRRTQNTAWAAAAGAPLLHRGLTGHCYVYQGLGVTTVSDDTRTALAGKRGVNVRESVRIERTADELYRFWRRFDNLPRFMHHLDKVVDLGDGRSRWTATGPAGSKVEWEAELVNDVENNVIAWRSLPGSDVVTAGSVTFRPVRAGGSTQITVNLQYEPPAGRAGSVVAWMFGHEPSQMIREDLRRLKQILEAGELATPGKSAAGVWQ